MMETHLQSSPPLAPHPPFGHLLSLEEAGEGLHDYRLLPPLLAEEGARRADEGPRAMSLNKLETR